MSATSLAQTVERLQAVALQCSTEAQRITTPRLDRAVLERMAKQLRQAATFVEVDRDYEPVALAWFDEGVNTLSAAILRRTVIRTTGADVG